MIFIQRKALKIHFRFWILMVFLSSGLAACLGGNETPVPIPSQEISIQENQGLVLEANQGQIKLRGSQTNTIQLSGQINHQYQNKFQIDTSNPAILKINFESPRSVNPGAPEQILDLQIEVPQGISVTIKTFAADVFLESINGSITVDSTAGDIFAQEVTGRIVLRSGRGDITARNCSGELSVLGEHGLLSIENSHGTIGSATIMGTIQYQGSPSASDDIRLEVDHGPVMVQLKEEADIAILAESTSGNVVCPPGLQATARSCSGQFGSGAGKLWIRTVSGNLTVQRIP